MADKLDKEKRYKLTVFKSSDDKSPVVYVGVNGNITQITKGVEVEVSEGVVESLKNAVKEVYSQEGGETIRTELPSYSFSARLI